MLYPTELRTELGNTINVLFKQRRVRSDKLLLTLDVSLVGVQGFYSTANLLILFIICSDLKIDPPFDPPLICTQYLCTLSLVYFLLD
jgi:hypothetical protein